jgi:hypothetical protein
MMTKTMALIMEENQLERNQAMVEITHQEKITAPVRQNPEIETDG